MGRQRSAPLIIAAIVLLLTVGTAAAAGEKVAVFGGDLTDAERQELSQTFGVDSATRLDTVTTPEMVTALQGSGLPVAETDKSISSATLTCLNKGDGLSVRTDNISRITAPVYANALVTAGVGDASVFITAPRANPVTGETALVGVLKAFPQCQAGSQPDAGRVRLAYEQIARTAALGGQIGDLNKASAIMLKAAQPVITRQARDDSAVGAALDAAVSSEGAQIGAAQRADTITFLRKLGAVDYGTYAQGYQLQQASTNEVKVLPAGVGAGTGTSSSTTDPANPGANAPVGGGAANTSFSGQVAQEGSPILVRVNGQDREVTPGGNLVVTRNGDAATIGDIQRDDTVTVTTNPDGTAQRIDATSDDGPAWWLWLLPLLLLLGLIGGFLWSRRRRAFILEPARSNVGSGDKHLHRRT